MLLDERSMINLIKFHNHYAYSCVYHAVTVHDCFINLHAAGSERACMTRFSCHLSSSESSA